MSMPVQLALTLGPLALYFLALGLLQGGRPRTLSGPIDFALLAFGLGGLIVFGPVGHLLVRTVFPAPSVWAWLALPSALCLVVLLWAPRMGRRLVIYNVDSATLVPALIAALSSQPGRFTPTLRGHEDTNAGRGIIVEPSRWTRTAVVEAYGRNPDELIATLSGDLSAALRAIPTRPSPLSRVWFAIAALLVSIPLLSLATASLPVPAVLRTWLGWLQ